MKTTLILIIAGAWTCTCTNIALSRVKRDYSQLAAMIAHTTGRAGLDYYGYGCWCGLVGRGQPKDGVDRCCQTLARCYEALSRKWCLLPIWQTYNFYLKTGIVCDGNKNNRCEQGTCECDKAAADCAARHTYHNQYKNWMGIC
ncbi:phospholipase A2 A2-actitoxin-Cgg2a-like [Lingula anatina]|uniref:Phospholipase A2 n=1 Tax=Lingula anatina TaxID=7574 RepID=A0A1S3I6C4_LINAN|nr:phospholipase A2 A2-actitoxin-Cgg2a-like [Lingula anatina]|eukprot:XP_013393807.1 phospholipase A2 A2-actitoxin-Cgg2a-like [Lingula anatina]